jgi:hypothetical protein
MTKTFEIDENYIDTFKNKLLNFNSPVLKNVYVKIEDIETIELKTVINSYMSNLIRK